MQKDKNIDKLMEFLQYTGELKRVKRSGWVIRGVKNPESVAEHSFRTAILAMLLAKKFKLNESKLIKMALIHDLGESIIGDIVWQKGKKTFYRIKKKKEEKEEEAMRKIFSFVKDGEGYFDIWREYRDQKSKEAILLKQIDKIEITLQAMEYKREGKNKSNDLGDMFINAEEYLKGKPLFSLYRKICLKK